MLDTVLRSTVWVQGWGHICAGIILLAVVGPLFSYTPAVISEQPAFVALLFGHLAMALMALARMVMAGNNPEERAKYRLTKGYWWACLFALVCHADYLTIFLFRQFKASTHDPNAADPSRAMEMEVAALRDMFLVPFGVTESAESLTSQFSAILQGGSKDAMNDPNMNILVRTQAAMMTNGGFLYWYQIFEGTNHLQITLGTLVYLLRPAPSKMTDTAVFWLYELGQVLQLVMYGPSYFWAITYMFMAAWFPSTVGMTVVPGMAVKGLATVFCLHHHLGYVVDQAATYQSGTAWGITWANKRDEPKAEKKL